jgi:AraC-like DNA-binding protein
MVKYSFLGGATLQKIDYLDKKQHGTAEFPIAYYYVNSTHPRYQMAFHWHNEWELLRVIEGELLLSLDEEQHRLKKGDIVLIPGETLHGGEPIDCEYECLVFNLYGLFGKTEAVKPHLRPFYRMDLVPDRFFSNNDKEAAAVLDVFKSGKDSPCLSLELMSAIANLFSRLIKDKRYQSASDKSRWSSRIKPVLEYIEAHYGEELSLDILAGVAGMNARYLCKVFYSLTHTTPMNYVNLYRIEQATFLLDSTDLPITQIATECGFWESSYFTKVFKKYKGTTPKRHRAAARAER